VAADTGVYINSTEGTGLAQVRVNTTGLVNGVCTFIEYDPACISITDIEASGPDWWLPTQPEYAEGRILFSAIRWGNSTGDFSVVNMTVTCGDNSCECYLNFTDNGNPLYRGVSGTELGDVSWTNETAVCAGSCSVCGDVDCNGYVSANDVVETYYKAVDPEYQLKSEWAADVDDNTYVSANDVVEIYRKAVNPEHVLNCAC